MTERERPKPRPRPRPAPDDNQDPILSSAGAAPPPQPPARPPAPPAGIPRPAGRGAIPTVQLNTRVAPEIDAVVNAVASERGWTKREVIEQAIKGTYPDELSSVLASTHSF